MADMIGSLNWRSITTVGTLSVGLPFPYGSNKLPELVGKRSPLLDLSTLKSDIVSARPMSWIVSVENGSYSILTVTTRILG